MSQMERTVILVIGPPRSGTSVVCNVLNHVGVDFGDPALFVDPESHAHNPVFFELEELNRINDEILQALGWRFRDFSATPLDKDFSPGFVAGFQERVDQFIREHFGASPIIGLKDPRFCFTLPLWTSILGTMGFRLRYLLTLREGEAVAASNYRLNPDLGLRHAHRILPLSMAAAKNLLGSMPHGELRFEDLMAFAPPALEAIASVSGVPVETVQAAATEVFDPQFVHWTPERGEGGEDPFVAAYADFVATSRRLGLPAVSGHDGDAGHGATVMSLAGQTQLASASPSGDTVQIYHRVSLETYSESRSSVVVWPLGQNAARVTFKFAAPVRLSHVRLDFGERAGMYRLIGLEVNGEPMSPRACATVANGSIIPSNEDDDVVVIANHTDPWLELFVGEREVSEMAFEIARAPFDRVYHQLFQMPKVERYIGRLEESINGVMKNVMHVEMALDAKGQQLEAWLQNLSADAGQAKSEQARIGQALERIAARVEELHDVHREGPFARLRRWFGAPRRSAGK